MSKYFTKILVAIDGSESSMAAADCAISVANNYESGLIALYVIESGTSILGPTPPPHLIEIKDQAQEYLDKIKHKASQIDGGIQLKTGSFENALSFACMNLSLSRKEWIRNSKIYKNMKEQMRITDFFSNNNNAL